jgi:DNA-binding FadR family transcriptional regulator
MNSASEEFTPIERQSIAEQVSRKIMAMIRSGNLKPGEQLPPERELAQMMQVSRPSMREALRGLQILGVLRMRQGGGIYVTTLDAADLLAPLQFFITLTAANVDALYEARRLIDTDIARRAGARLEAADIERLGAMVEVQRHLIHDPIGYRVSDLEFHQTIIAAAANPFLERMAQSLYVLGMEYRRVAAETPAVLAQSVADHGAIVAALAARDPAALTAAVERHLHGVYVSTRDAMEPKP